jgi:hypothetical protein
MTPKEKALELYNKFFTNVPFLTAGCHPLDDYNAAKQCALIAVDEILNSILGNYEFDFLRNYWQEVKQEI